MIYFSSPHHLELELLLQLLFVQYIYNSIYKINTVIKNYILVRNTTIQSLKQYSWTLIKKNARKYTK